MVETDNPSESRDGTGAADHDKAYAFGNPRGGLTTIDFARCLVMRGYVRDVSHAPDSIRGELRFGNDNDWVKATPSGLLVPVEALLHGNS